jgi:hypothetical protein
MPHAQPNIVGAPAQLATQYLEGGGSVERKTEDACPEWIDEFIEDVGVGIGTGDVQTAYSVYGPNKADPKTHGDPWIVQFYPALSEIVGGPNDGTVVHSGLEVDLISVQEAFEDVEDMRWTSGVGFDETPYTGAILEIRGVYDGNDVTLQVYDKPPGDKHVVTVIDFRKVLLGPQDRSRG